VSAIIVLGLAASVFVYNAAQRVGQRNQDLPQRSVVDLGELAGL